MTIMSNILSCRELRFLKMSKKTNKKIPPFPQTKNKREIQQSFSLVFGL